MDLVDLVQLIGAGEEWSETVVGQRSVSMRVHGSSCCGTPHDLKQHTTDTPHVHLVTIVAVSQQTLWGSVPDEEEEEEEEKKERWKS